MASPLTDLIKKDSFTWNAPTTRAIEILKKAITTQPVLTLPNFEIPFTIETDASGLSIGALLSQGKHPIVFFFSKKLSPSMQCQTTYTREFYVITQALAKFRHYVMDKHFIILTNQQSLKVLLDQRLHTPEQHKWLHKFLGYDFEIRYKPEFDNEQ